MYRIEPSNLFHSWMRRLRDRRAKHKVLRLVERMRHQGPFFGDWKNLGGGIIEHRINLGPGYRVYLSLQGSELLLLLVGGDKSTQQRDIERARAVLRNWRKQHGGNFHIVEPC